MIQRFKTYFFVVAILWYKRIIGFIFKKSTSYQKFAIVCTARSGSTWLHTLLNSHPSIHSEGEIIRDNHLSDESKSFDEFAFQPYARMIKAVGLKIFHENSVYAEGLDTIIEDSDVKIILLRRKSILEQFVSLKIAEESKEWIYASDATKQVLLDPEEYDTYRELQIRMYKQIVDRLTNKEFIEISYEEMLQDKDKTLKTIQQFLGVKHKKLYSLLRKQGAKKISDQIANWEEVKENFK